jgi:CRP-like cAMP-binding protein
MSRSTSSRSYEESVLAPEPATHQEQGTVARAVEDSTLAVIPAEAFRRLTKKFPKATAHIVQGMRKMHNAIVVHAELAISHTNPSFSGHIHSGT